MVNGTVPALLLAAADRDPDGTWLRTDDGTATFAVAAGQVAAHGPAARARPGSDTATWSW